MVVILVIDDGDLRPLGMEFLDLRYMRSGVAERDELELRFAFRAMGHVELNIHLLAIRTASAQIAVNQKVGLNLMDIHFFINTHQFFSHTGGYYNTTETSFRRFMKILPLRIVLT